MIPSPRNADPCESPRADDAARRRESGRRRRCRGAWAAVCCAFAFSTAAWAQASSPGGDVDSRPARTLAGNVYRAGDTVHVTEPVDGDLLAAGGQVSVEQAVARDAALAGGNVSIGAAIGDDLRAVGGQVALDAAVAGEAHVAAGRIRLGRGAVIGSDAWLAGGDVEVLGRLPSGSRIYAGNVVLGGEVDGDLLVQADRIELQPDARIKGTLTYASRNPLLRDPGAQVGSIVQQPLSDDRRRHERARPGPFSWIASVVGLVAAGLVWALLFPGLAGRAEARLAAAPGVSLALGVAVVLAAPLAALLLLITILGAPLAVALMAAYGLVLLAGFLVVAGALGERLLQAAKKELPGSRKQRLLALAAAIVLLALLGTLPLLGFLITLLVVMAGTGALVAQFRPRAAPTPT